jgi:hypothetical protein
MRFLDVIPNPIAVRLKTEQIQLAADCVFFECGPAFGKCLEHRHFLEEGDASLMQYITAWLASSYEWSGHDGEQFAC